MDYRGQPLVWAGLALALSVGAPTVRAAPDDGAQTATSADAVRVVRDKETGKLRAPTDAELEQMRQNERSARKARGRSESGATAPIAVRQHANGMRSAVLGPEYLVTLKAQRGADGKLTVKHDKVADEHGAGQSQRPTE